MYFTFKSLQLFINLIPESNINYIFDNKSILTIVFNCDSGRKRHHDALEKVRRWCRVALWETKIPRSIQEVVRGGTGCISIRGDGWASSRKTILSAFRTETIVSHSIHRRSAFQGGVWLHRLRFVIKRGIYHPLPAIFITKYNRFVNGFTSKNRGKIHIIWVRLRRNVQ